MTQKSVEITQKGAQHSFSHPDCTVGTGISPDRAAKAACGL